MATTQTSAQARGVVVILEGNAWLVTADGTRRPLKVGDEVQVGQQIITEDGARLELALPNGQPLTIASGRELLIEGNLLGTEPTDKTEAALKDLNSGSAQIAKVIAGGGDLSTELDPTAAGLTGGDTGDSHSFVRVLRISEELTSLTLERDAPVASADQIDFGGATATVTPDVTQVAPPVVEPPAAAPSVSISGASDVNEAAGTVTYTVTLSSASLASVTVNYASANGAALAGSDYAATSGMLTFAPGETVKTFTVAISNDSPRVFEGPEAYSVTLSAPSNATIGTGSVTTTIHDDGAGLPPPVGTPPDDDRPTVASVSSPSVGEGGNLDFVLTLSNASTTPTTVTLTPASGTGASGAILGTDTAAAPTLVSFDGGTTFVAIVGNIVTVPAGATSFIVRLPTNPDALIEGSETLTLGAGTPANAAPVVGTGTITDTTPTITSVEPGAPGLGDNNVVEGNSLVYTVTLSSAPLVLSTYSFVLGGGSATAGADYNATPVFSAGVTYNSVTGMITVPVGVASFTVTVATIDDAIIDSASPESLPLVIGGVTGNGGILDNEQPTITSVEPGAPGLGDNNV
ncbi:MAG: retention module-containing protein, partial [Rhodoferax sp.]